MRKFNRRKFLAALGPGVMSIGGARGLTSPHEGRSFRTPSEDPPVIRSYRDLGRTGLKISDVGCGAISLFEPNVLRYAFERGVTYFDTAETYIQSNSERYIGQALAGVRDKIILTTKLGFSSPARIRRDNIVRRMDACLARMKTEYVDIAMVHGLQDLSLLDNPELLAGYEQLKRSGKVRFTGVSTHNAAVTLPQALESDFVDVMLVIYNHMEGPSIEPLLLKAGEKGIGIIAMKVFAGGKHGRLASLIGQDVSYPQAAIRWALSGPGIDACVVTMSSYSHVDEYTAASGQPLNRDDLGVIAAYQEQAGPLYCRISCQSCLDACPRGVAINDVLRYGMYFEDYHREKDAMRHYADLPEARRPLPCSDCEGPCDAACPHGLAVREMLIHAHKILSP